MTTNITTIENNFTLTLYFLFLLVAYSKWVGFAVE